MRAVIQRVKEARVRVDERIVGEIDAGLLVLLGVEQEDTREDAEYLATKIAELRIFEDSENKMNLSLGDVEGAALVVSQFTLLGDCRKGRRPGFSRAARPELAISLYEHHVEKLKLLGVPIATGQFQTDMQVELINDGPVTLILDSHKTF